MTALNNNNDYVELMYAHNSFKMIEWFLKKYLIFSYGKKKCYVGMLYLWEKAATFGALN